MSWFSTKVPRAPYWLHEVFDDAEVTISIDTHDGEPPTDWQVNFFQEITRDEQSTYERVRVRLSVEHERMHGESVRSDWRQTFRLAGIGVPLDGWELNPWDITYKCRTDRSGYLYTCHFEYGLLRDVSIGT